MASGGGEEGSREKKKWADSKVYSRKSFKGLKTNNDNNPSNVTLQQAENLASEEANLPQNRYDVALDDSTSLNRLQVTPVSDRRVGGGNGLGKQGVLRQENKVTISLVSRSKQEMWELRRKLQSELDLVRNWVKKFEGKEGKVVNGGVDNAGVKRVQSEAASVGPARVSRPLHQLSISVLENSQSVSDNTEKEKRTPKANQFYRNSEFLLAKDKFPPAESNKKSKLNGKKQGGTELGLGFGLGKFSNQAFKSCSALLDKLMKHKHGWVFNTPVDPEALGLHDYFDVIKHPMDLGTVKSRLNMNWYKSPREFAEDVRLTFSNAMTYNPKGQDVHAMAEQLSKVFEEKWSSIEDDYMRELRMAVTYEVGIPTPTSRKAPSLLSPPTEMRTIFARSETMSSAVDPKPKPRKSSHPGRTPAPKKPKARDPNKRDLTYDEKQKLSTNLQNLPSDKLDNIVQIIKKRNTSLSQNDDEIEVDIDSVDTETLWELDRFVTNYKKGLSKNKKKAEPATEARAEIRPEAQAQGKNPDPSMVEAPKERKSDEKNISSSPIQVENQGRNASRSSSSSGSSSGSGSSSSGSDSESSSGSDAVRSPRT